MALELAPIWLTLKLATVTTASLLVVGTPLAWWLVRTRSRLRVVVGAMVTLPLILPPTVLGFYLLLILSARGPIGRLMIAFGLDALPFTFWGLVVGSMVYSLPFVVQPLQQAFQAAGRRSMDVAFTLGAGPLDAFFSVVVPQAMPGFMTAAVLGFAHTVGEFGVVLMLGGNIPGKTRVVSVQIYDHVEAFEYGQAHVLAGGLIVLSLLVLFVVEHLRKKSAVLEEF